MPCTFSASPTVKAYVKKICTFTAICGDPALRIVEKTCANSLRVDFVNEIFPSAKYIYIRRDPLLAIDSALNKSRVKSSFSYQLKKLRYVPKKHLFSVVSTFAYRRILMSLPTNSNLSWGPITEDFCHSHPELPAYKLLAIQWAKCVSMAEQSLLPLSNQPFKVSAITYESFVKSPTKILSKVLSDLNLSQFSNLNEIRSATASVRSILFPVKYH